MTTANPIMTNLGFHGVKSMLAADYFAAPGVSNSMLKHFARSPAHLQHYLKVGQEETKAMRFGTMMHAAVLEPDLFKNNYIASPVFDKRTKAGKEGYGEFAAANLGKIVVDQDDFDTAAQMAFAILDHPKAKALLGAGMAEQSMFCLHEETGVLRKARTDFLTGGNAITDLKTCENASPRAFQRTIGDYSYMVQAAYYLNIANDLGLEKEMFCFIAVEKTAPFGVGVYYMDKASLSLGKDIYEAQLHKFADCAKANHWPCYSEELEEISSPAWCFNAF